MASLGITYSIKMDKTRGDKDHMTTRDRVLVLEEAYDERVLYNIARGYRHFMNFRVPKKSGALRDCARALANKNTSLVFWRPNEITRPYMHYQYVGDVYGPNKVKYDNAGNLVWRSAAAPGGKYNTGRKMGHKFHKVLRDGRVIDVKGYTTTRPLHTGYDWINTFKNDKGKYGQAAVSIQSGRFIYESYCKRTGKRCYGGYQVYHRWRTY